MKAGEIQRGRGRRKRFDVELICGEAAAITLVLAYDAQDAAEYALDFVRGGGVVSWEGHFDGHDPLKDTEVVSVELAS